MVGRENIVGGNNNKQQKKGMHPSFFKKDCQAILKKPDRNKRLGCSVVKVRFVEAVFHLMADEIL